MTFCGPLRKELKTDQLQVPAVSTSDSREGCLRYRRPSPRSRDTSAALTAAPIGGERLIRRGLPRTAIRGYREHRGWAPARGPGQRRGRLRHGLQSITVGISGFGIRVQPPRTTCLIVNFPIEEGGALKRIGIAALCETLDKITGGRIILATVSVDSLKTSFVWTSPPHQQSPSVGWN